MNTRWIGVASMAVGGVLTVVGAVGMLTAGDQSVAAPETIDSTTTTEPSTTSTTEPTTTSTASSSTTTQAPPTTELPTTSTTTLPDPADVEVFVNQFVAWIEASDSAALVGRLHPVVIEEYGVDLCQEFVEREILALENYRSTGSVNGPEASQFGSVDIDVYRVPVAFIFQGEEFTSDAAFAFVEGTVHWFATCR